MKDWWFTRLFQRRTPQGVPVRPTPQQVVQAAKAAQIPRERAQAHKRQTRYTYTDGPMMYLGQQIIKRMEDAGYPSKIVYCFRGWDLQAELYAKGRTAPGRRVTNAPPGHSPHQWYEAVDICHKTLGWKVSDDYWMTLHKVVRQVAEIYDVSLTHGEDWDGDGIRVSHDPDETFRDAAHIELTDWRLWRERLENRRFDLEQPPTEQERWERFKEVLPKVAAAWERRQ